jgi:hypothetical protein
MSYTTLTSYQFERGKGFTEESVLAFRSLAFAAIDELIRSQSSSTATFPLSDDELRLVLNHRAAAAAETAPPLVSEPMSSYLSQEVAVPVSAAPPANVAEAPDADVDLGSPPDDDFAAAARWLALATRNQTEAYQPSLVRQRG